MKFDQVIVVIIEEVRVITIVQILSYKMTASIRVMSTIIDI